MIKMEPVPNEDLQLFEDVTKQVMGLLSSCHPASTLKKESERKAMMTDHLINTEQTVGQLITELVKVEEGLAQKLIHIEEERQIKLHEYQKAERELLQASETNAHLKSELQFLQKDLEDLKEMQEETARIEKEVAEDTTVVIPSAAYLAQLYYKVAKIIWDYSCDATQIKGIHYGPEVAHPIDIDSTQHSKPFICDYLWSLVSTDW
ncbi:kinetochore protein Spc24 [Latimeria chalumnae]|uniref:kinetochore protein Spc24 n=1 Tax=Latimeria chalumnae TaxID=7897 RepID=UPI0003C1A59B|nr:PREDICTED: kinetochore protein Spc24 [Latimeria chalumnae]|eukprot:XP_005994225.1 PREDICTED: kinetochore protein Spc24 [Latimeria chalumnae]